MYQDLVDTLYQEIVDTVALCLTKIHYIMSP